MRFCYYLIVSVLISLLGEVNLYGESLNVKPDVERSDLEIRVDMFDSEGYRMAVDHLTATFPNRYRPLKGWERALETVERGVNASGVKEIESAFNILDRNLLRNPLIKERNIVAVKRHFDKGARSRMSRDLGIAPTNFQNNSEISNPKSGWVNEFVSFQGVGTKKSSEELLFCPDSGVIILDPEPHFDGNKLMYSSIGTDDRWHLFEFDRSSSTTKQLTPDSYKDFDSFDGCYTPDGRYIFSSTGTFLGLPCTDGGNKMCGLFSYDPKIDETRQLTYDQDSNMGPVVLNSGQILYLRWEYADLPHSNSRIIFTMNPDGTSQQAKYGSNSYFPTSFFHSRPIPGHPTAIVGVASGHHGNSRSGRLIILDSAIGRHEADGVVAEIPHRGREVKPLVRDRFADGVWPQFLTPYPLDENFFIVSMKATETSLWGLYLVDRFNNMTPIAEEEGIAYLEPVILESKETPPIIPDRVDMTKDSATVFIQDIYFGGGLKSIPRGEVKSLRVMSYSFSPHNQGGLLGTIGMDGPWDVKFILGTVPVESDGSAMFKVPANTPIALQPLDSEGKALQVMRSWFTAMPGEMLSCIGCHEDKSSVALPKRTTASKQAPTAISQWNGEPRGFSYEDEVQPLLDKYCISCHSDADNNKRPYLKGDKKITDWSSQIAGRAWNGNGGAFSRSYADLHRFVRRPGIESDMHMLVPMDVHADQTELMQIINKGHHNVELTPEDITVLSCWIDFNAPFHGERGLIPRSELSRRSNELRDKYAKLFHAPASSCSLPEKSPKSKPTIEPVVPIALVYDTATPVIKGWPYSSGEAIQKQLGLGLVTRFVTVADDIELEMVHIPSGEFVMGSERNGDELPKNRVSIDRPFWIGRFEITNRQYRAFRADHDSRDEHRHGYQFGRRGYDLNRDDQPVVRISWREAIEFCKWLSNKSGLEIDLPTEAEWEWSCRAGSSSAYSFGPMESNYSRFANLGDQSLIQYAACTSHKFYEGTRELIDPNRYDDWVPHDTLYNDGVFLSERGGVYRPNVWGLNDMHGNVWEWTKSEYRPYPYIADDGRDSVDGEGKRVVRGGSWYDRPSKGTSSYRLFYRDYQPIYNVGFRVIIRE